MIEFDRSEMLLGKEAIKKLEKSTVLVFGVGGVGSYVVEALARSGVGKFILVDADEVDITNINRQIIALHSTVGRPKTEVAGERIKDINPNAEVLEKNIFYTPENGDEVDFSGVDYVVDAIDTVTTKLYIIEKAKKMGIPVISSMGTGNKINPSLFKIGDISKTSVCPLARVMRKELKDRGISGVKVLWSEEKPYSEITKINPVNNKKIPASISFVPSVAGLMIAGEVILDITKGK